MMPCHFLFNIVKQDVVVSNHIQVTISGETKLVQTTVDDIKNNRGKFAKMVNSTGVAFHSPQMRAAEKMMTEALASVSCFLYDSFVAIII